MQFYKNRDFGELISATFDFVKLYGRDYFKKYIILNGLIIILLMVVVFIGYGEFFSQMFGGNLGGEQFFFEDYFAENTSVFILVSIITFIVFVLLSMVSYSFPVLYMKRVSETEATEVSLDEMTADLKSVIPKFLIFFLGMLFIIMPIMLIVFGISMALMFILIGFLLMILLVPAVMNIINFAFFHHYHTDEGFFKSISYAMNSTIGSKSFWKYWGSLAIMYILIQVITSIFSFLPMIVLGSADFFQPAGLADESAMLIGIVVISIYAFSIVASLVLTNLVYINTGFMYYDSRKDLHRNIQFSEIDSLGTSEV
ncbi:hypothetical protein NMK71_04115 [Weeksellaceae bacterium KMM 9713]|uniref:DUF4013 domain-containing protein n=1 Tax=Profundicola chukchiensis TaxID=2961959 RepID=A0A9X4MX38_9FLAO|nr:hypothetical protein [Profundicola chukchiensis]MDG4945589.1 hypothetical protein [Profundicola chukchiensis]